MEWRDRGIVLSVRPHGETSAILELLTREHGRHLGLVRGGRSRRLRAALQTGNSLEVVWRARLAEHLGMWNAELREARAAALMAEALPLTAVMAAASLCRLLPERDACPRMHDGLEHLLQELAHGGEGWPLRLVLWELQLLRELGYGLELDSCALGGDREDISYVSPHSGKAVSAGLGADHAESLLALPVFLRPGATAENIDVSAKEIVAGLRLSAHFLERHGFADTGGGLPPMRLRLGELLERRGQEGGADNPNDRGSG